MATWELPGNVRLVVEPLSDGTFEASMFEPRSERSRGALFTINAGCREWAEDAILGLYRAEMLRRATRPIADLLVDHPAAQEPRAA